MEHSIEDKKQAIKDIKKVLENKGLTLAVKMGLLSEIKALEASITLIGQVKKGNWVILKDKNMYYQFNCLEKISGRVDSRVVLIRKGERHTTSEYRFNTEYRLATPSEVKEHEQFLLEKRLKGFGVMYADNNSYKIKHDLIKKPYFMKGINEASKSTFNPMKCDFYMVTCTGLHGSKVRHYSYSEAEAEATRIAKKRNHEAWIVGVVASVKPVTETLSNTKVVIKKR